MRKSAKPGLTHFCYTICLWSFLSSFHFSPDSIKKACGGSATGFTQKRHTLYAYYSRGGWRFQMFFGPIWGAFAGFRVGDQIKPAPAFWAGTGLKRLFFWGRSLVHAAQAKFVTIWSRWQKPILKKGFDFPTRSLPFLWQKWLFPELFSRRIF